MPPADPSDTLREQDLRDLAVSVAGRVLAERGAPPRTAAAGIHVAAHTPRPAAGPGGSHPRPQRALVSERDLASPEARAPEALWTPLAAEEAWLRRRKAHGAPNAAGTGPFRVALACDHGGFGAKAGVAAWLARRGHRVEDLGVHDERPADYPDLAARAARAVQTGRADVAVVLDGAGVGSAMTANKLAGVRAANGATPQLARNAREHNYANVLTLGARLLDAGAIEAVLEAFFTTPWGEARHGRRVAKITELEGAERSAGR